MALTEPKSVTPRLKYIKLPLGGELEIHTRPDGKDVGNFLWGSVKPFVGTILNNRVFPADFWVGKRVLELGAGTGAAGLALAKAGAHVTLSDLESLIPLLEENVEANGLKSKVETIPLDWKQPSSWEPASKIEWDVIVGTDIVYYPSLHKPLLEVIKALIPEDSSTLLLLAYEARKGNSTFFLQGLPKAGFKCFTVPLYLLEHHHKDVAVFMIYRS